MDDDDLPAELLRELSTSKPKAREELESKIVSVMRDCGACASVDQILVGMYRKHRIILKRHFLRNKLYRMGLRGGHEGRKSMFTTPHTGDE